MRSKVPSAIEPVVTVRRRNHGPQPRTLSHAEYRVGVAAKRLTREESREQTRERLLAAAAELFAERGVNGTSVEQIAERAGYTRGAFYGNFDGKPELLVALLRQRT